MEKATIGYFNGISNVPGDPFYRFFLAPNSLGYNPKDDNSKDYYYPARLLVKDIDKDGIVTVDSRTDGCKDADIISLVVGCFEDESNFGSAVLSQFNCPTDIKFSGIRFEYYDIPVLVTKDNANVSAIKNYVYQQMLVGHNKIQQEAVAWVLSIDETVEMEFKDTESERIWNEKSKDPKNSQRLTYARRWAKCMQVRISEGASVIKCAWDTYQKCSVSPEGPTGYPFWFDSALTLLISYWKHGEELLEWYKTRF